MDKFLIYSIVYVMIIIWYYFDVESDLLSSSSYLLAFVSFSRFSCCTGSFIFENSFSYIFPSISNFLYVSWNCTSLRRGHTRKVETFQLNNGGNFVRNSVLLLSVPIGVRVFTVFKKR